MGDRTSGEDLICYRLPISHRTKLRGVRRQGFWNQWRLNLRESSAHLVVLIMRRVVCDASVALRVFFLILMPWNTLRRSRSFSMIACFMAALMTPMVRRAEGIPTAPHLDLENHCIDLLYCGQTLDTLQMVIP